MALDELSSSKFKLSGDIKYERAVDFLSSALQLEKVSLQELSNAC